MVNKTNKYLCMEEFPVVKELNKLIYFIELLQP